MQFSDLHIHSTFSDGNLNPHEIIKIANTRGVRCVSITDHDTIESQIDLEMYVNGKNPVVIPGVEISTMYENCEVHILGYFIDINNTKLRGALKAMQFERTIRINDIIEALNKIDISISKNDIEIEKYISLGRPHIAKILVDKGYSLSVREAFHQYLARGKPGFIERYKINYKDALKLIVEAGGIPVLAHPGEIYKGLNIDTLIKNFKVYGLKGIEVYHPSHSSIEVNKFYNIAKKYSILVTGGSDCHGAINHNDSTIGNCGINEALTEKLFKYRSKLLEI
jgi:predicted metal-dependent phosphoesterase TrpH